MQTDADTIRQAICKTSGGKYILATFATDRGQREWLNGAKDYGGYYLVGRKWVAVGEQKTVTALRGQLGGTMEEGSEHMNPGGSHNKQRRSQQLIARIRGASESRRWDSHRRLPTAYRLLLVCYWQS